jgi:hypothetical protein
VHPQQWGCFRRKDRKQRRPEVARVAALPFYLTHGFQTLVYGLKTLRMRSRVQRDPALKTYRDLATTPVIDAEGESRTSSRSLTSHPRPTASSKRNWTMPRPTMETAAIPRRPSRWLPPGGGARHGCCPLAEANGPVASNRLPFPRNLGKQILAQADETQRVA